MCLKRLNYDRKELEKRREESQHEIKGKLSRLSVLPLKDMGAALGEQMPASLPPALGEWGERGHSVPQGASKPPGSSGV